MTTKLLFLLCSDVRCLIKFNNHFINSRGGTVLMKYLCKLICRVDQAFWVFSIKAVYCDVIYFTI